MGKMPTYVVDDNILSAEHRGYLASHSLLLALSVQFPSDNSLPDISQIPIPSPGPFGVARVLDAEPCIEGEAVGSRGSSEDGRFSFLSDRSALCLAGEEHRMGIGIAAGDDLVDQEADQAGSDACGVDVPFAEDACDRLVQLQQEVISKTHGCWMIEEITDRRGC
jgi:hypothetical protein